MTTTEINILFSTWQRDLTNVAEEIRERRDQVSQVVNYIKANRRIRLKLAVYFGMPIEQMFDKAEPMTNNEWLTTTKSLRHVKHLQHLVAA